MVCASRRAWLRADDLTSFGACANKEEGMQVVPEEAVQIQSAPLCLEPDHHDDNGALRAGWHQKLMETPCSAAKGTLTFWTGLATASCSCAYPPRLAYTNLCIQSSHLRNLDVHNMLPQR